jgi:hypothetical protein
MDQAIQWLREDPQGPGAGPELPEREAGDASEEAVDEGRILVCRECRLGIASTADRIAVGGRHRHVFFNPAGLVFELGLFSSAPGCVPVGPLVGEFSWFPGHAWRICLCARCAAHLGWLYLSGASTGFPTGFHGLILDRLDEQGGGQGG